VIATGVITQRANSERFPAQTIERDYVLAHLCTDIGAIGDARLVLKGGTLLRLCYFADYRYSADLDFSAINGLNRSDAIAIIADAAAACRQRIDLPMLNLSDTEGEAPWVMYIGPHDVRRALVLVAAGNSSRTVTLAHNALTRVLRHAEANRHVAHNVAALVDTPKGQPGRPSKALTAEQAAAALTAAEGPGSVPT
jgi:hypothetical protein